MWLLEKEWIGMCLLEKYEKSKTEMRRDRRSGITNWLVLRRLKSWFNFGRT